MKLLIFLFTRGGKEAKTPFHGPGSHCLSIKLSIGNMFFPPASNDANQRLSNKYPGKDTVNKPPLYPLRPRDKRRKPVTVK